MRKLECGNKIVKKQSDINISFLYLIQIIDFSDELNIKWKR